MKPNKTNLTEPEEIFNFLGEQTFEKEWSHLPLQILQRNIDKSKFSKEVYRRNKYMADRIFKKFSKFLKNPDVSIYTTSEPYDIEVTKHKIVKWEKPYFRISSKDFLLIEQEIDKIHGSYDVARRHFWIEMPKEKNPLLFKKRGPKPRHDKDYLISILEDVLKLNDGKITYSSLSNSYKKYLVGTNVPAPSDTWLCEHMAKEIEPYK